MNWLTANAAARRLRRHPDLVRRWLRDGRLRAERFGNAWMISQRELERFERNAPERRRPRGLHTSRRRGRAGGLRRST